MPVDPLSLALMAVNVGASVFNNWRNNKQSHKLQEKQQEFACAAAELNKQRMWQLMREGQELALEMEQETHKKRLEDICNDFDRILHRLAYIEAIKTWPLKVLPVVMKNQSLGSLTATADENIAMHCILTPSNCAQFNKHILPTIEEKLADFCNLHWSTLSSHPILFYSGAWKTGTIPTGVEVSQLKTNLRNLPTLLITPFFKTEGGITFQINAWGIGVELETEIECADFSYAESYKSGIDYQIEEDIKERTIEEFVPYLQCLIGYIADQYFWTNHNESPLLPTMLAMHIVNADGMQYLNVTSKERYSNLLDVYMKESQAMLFNSDKMLSLLEGSSVLWDDSVRKDKLEEIFVIKVQGRSENKISSMKEALSCDLYSKEDLPFLRGFIELYQYNDYKEELLNVIEVLESIDFDYSILESTDIAYLEQLANEGNGVAMFRLGEIYECSIGTDFNPDLSDKYYTKAINAMQQLAVVRAKVINRDSIAGDVDFLASIESVQSSILLSKAFYYGLGVEQCTERAMAELEKWSNSNHPQISYIAAEIVIQEYGTQQKELIEELLIRSSNLGYIKAQLKLMELYEDGAILQESPYRVVEYARKAALQGHPDGLLVLALCYIRGYGVNINKNKSKELLVMAADRGNMDAIEIINQLK